MRSRQQREQDQKSEFLTFLGATYNLLLLYKAGGIKNNFKIYSEEVMKIEKFSKDQNWTDSKEKEGDFYSASTPFGKEVAKSIFAAARKKEKDYDEYISNLSEAIWDYKSEDILPKEFLPVLKDALKEDAFQALILSNFTEGIDDTLFLKAIHKLLELELTGTISTELPCDVGRFHTIFGWVNHRGCNNRLISETLLVGEVFARLFLAKMSMSRDEATLSLNQISDDIIYYEKKGEKSLLLETILEKKYLIKECAACRTISELGTLWID